MASTSGTKGPFEISRQPSKRMIRAPTRTVELPNEENIEIEGENPRVAYLCEFFFHFFLPFLLNYILYYIHIHL
jgi:callose synthase